ncbi:MAG: hypothetical protein KAH23_00770 [Kiritimatiellae bacterium]|nr:hypothetical protein [Kiritimatiellia bacterium]
MTHSGKMMETVSRPARELGSSAERIRCFLESVRMSDGGFKGRGQESDLYYTAFALDCMVALGMDVTNDDIAKYLTEFGVGDGLDLVHLACLARCWLRADRHRLSGTILRGIIDNIEGCRSDDGGYHRERDAEYGSIYGCFFADSAYQDLGLEIPDVSGIVSSVMALKTADGLFIAERGMNIVTTNAVAGALLLLNSFDEPIPGTAVSWLIEQCHDDGGFVAAPKAPVSDLVSTATALFALQEVGVSLEGIKERCTTFVEGLWDDKGGFRGHCLDDTVDCEYTFYGLLSLGVLKGEDGESFTMKDMKGSKGGGERA